MQVYARHPPTQTYAASEQSREQQELCWACFLSQQSELCKKTSREQPMLRILLGFGPSRVLGVSAECVDS